MKNPTPLSNEWLYWDPETIHSYPNPGDPPDLTHLEVVPEKITPHVTVSKIQARLLIRELMRDIAAGVVSGLVAAILLALLIVFFPSTSRAEADESPVRLQSVNDACPTIGVDGSDAEISTLT